MDSAKATKGERDLPETEKRRPTGLGTVTAVFLLSLPLLILLFLFGDRAVASIAGNSLVWQRAGVQSTCSFRSLAYTHLMHGNGPALTLPFVCIAGSGNTSSSPVNAHHDLLLGGLLSPDFDAATCLSRYEASKRWKTPPPFPVSPYLVQKLRQYESNHRRCGPGTANYREAMAQLTSGRNGDRAECRYVVWFPIQGMGNRMLDVRLRRALAGWAATLAADAAGPDYAEGRRGLR